MPIRQILCLWRRARSVEGENIVHTLAQVWNRRNGQEQIFAFKHGLSTSEYQIKPDTHDWNICDLKFGIYLLFRQFPSGPRDK